MFHHYTGTTESEQVHLAHANAPELMYQQKGSAGRMVRFIEPRQLKHNKSEVLQFTNFRYGIR
jgi:hypothetical protein